MQQINHPVDLLNKPKKSKNKIKKTWKPLQYLMITLKIENQQKKKYCFSVGNKKSLENNNKKKNEHIIL